MNKKLIFLSFMLLIFAWNHLFAQSGGTRNSNISSSEYPKIILSATVSTQGVGGDIKVLPIPTFGIRAGVSVLPFNWQTIYTGRTEPTDLKLDADFANAHLMFDWHPISGRYNLLDKIVITAGGAYWWKDKGTAVISYRGNYNYGDIVIPSDDLGQLKGEVQWKKVTPYLGLGLENILSDRTINLGFAIGAYYMGKPDATLTGTKMLSANVSNSEQFEKNMSFYRFLPVLQVNLNFNL